MKVPIKITPDNLKHAIINIKFTPICPPEFFHGYVYPALKDDFEYVPLPPFPGNQDMDTNSPVLQIGYSGVTGVFQNGKIRLQIHGSGSLVFSNWDKYLGWKVFLEEIKKVLKKINNLEVVSSYRAVGMRYISEYVNESIFDKIENTFPISIKERKAIFKSSIFKTEITEGHRKIVINIGDKLDRINKSSISLNGTEQFSIIDIDIITPINVQSIRDLEAIIEESHTIEKEIFFGMLKDDFIATLQPIYI